jgi:hypothetical protein
MPDVKYEYELDRLYQAWLKSRISLEKPRVSRREAAREVVGGRYADNDANHEVYIPLLSMYVDIVLGNLVSDDPRVMLDTSDVRKKPTVKAQEAWANQQFKRMGLADTLQRWVVDAGYGTGVLKLGIASPAEADQRAGTATAGMPYIGLVGLDDFAFDPYATDWAETGFEANRYRVPLASVKDDSTYNRVRKTLTGEPPKPYNREGDERARMISRGWRNSGASDDELEEHVDLWEFYCRREGLLMTFAEEQLWGDSVQEPLAVRKFSGPSCGLFYKLGLTLPVPDQCLSVGPIQRLYPMHALVNRLYRKLSKQAGRQKQVSLYPGNQTEDMNRLRQAQDGDVIQFDKPDAVKVWSSPGADAANAAFSENARNLYSWMAGNLDAAGGLAPQAKTLGQDRLLAEGSTRAIGHMSRRVVTGTSDVMKGLLYYYHTHPTIVQRSRVGPRDLPDIGVDRYVLPRNHPLATMRPPREPGTSLHVRDFPYDDVDVQAHPYTFKNQTPGERGQMIDQLVMGMVAPMMPMLQQQQIAFNARKWLQLKSEYDNNPDIPELLTIGDPPDPDAPTPGPSHQAGMTAPGGPAAPPAPDRSSVTGPGASAMYQAAQLGRNPGGAPSSNGHVATIGG